MSKHGSVTAATHRAVKRERDALRSERDRLLKLYSAALEWHVEEAAPHFTREDVVKNIKQRAGLA